MRKKLLKEAKRQEEEERKAAEEEERRLAEEENARERSTFAEEGEKKRPNVSSYVRKENY